MAKQTIEETLPEQSPEMEQVPKPVALPAPLSGIYPTDYYRSNNIPFCEVCGEKLRADPISQKPLCAEQRAQCPRNL